KTDCFCTAKRCQTPAGGCASTPGIVAIFHCTLKGCQNSSCRATVLAPLRGAHALDSVKSQGALAKPRDSGLGSGTASRCNNAPTADLGSGTASRCKTHLLRISDRTPLRVANENGLGRLSEAVQNSTDSRLLVFPQPLQLFFQVLDLLLDRGLV